MGRKWKQPRPPEIMRKGGAHSGKRKPDPDFYEVEYEGDWDLDYVDDDDTYDERVEELEEYRHGEG